MLSVDWKRYDYPSAGTVYDYYFHTKPIWVPPHHTWIKGGTATQDIRAYGHQGLGRTVKPFDQLMSGYQRIFYLYGPLFGIILFLGLGSLIRVYRRNGRFRLGRWRDGPSKMPFVCALVLLVFPIMVADFDYRYVLPVVPFACLAAGLAFASPASRRGPGRGPVPRGRRSRAPQPHRSNHPLTIRRERFPKRRLWGWRGIVLSWRASRPGGRAAQGLSTWCGEEGPGSAGQGGR